jgi:hypothetical protein
VFLFLKFSAGLPKAQQSSSMIRVQRNGASEVNDRLGVIFLLEAGEPAFVVLLRYAPKTIGESQVVRLPEGSKPHIPVVHLQVPGPKTETHRDTGSFPSFSTVIT